MYELIDELDNFRVKRVAQNVDAGRLVLPRLFLPRSVGRLGCRALLLPRLSPFALPGGGSLSLPSLCPLALPGGGSLPLPSLSPFSLSGGGSLPLRLSPFALAGGGSLVLSWLLPLPLRAHPFFLPSGSVLGKKPMRKTKSCGAGKREAKEPKGVKFF